MDSSEICFTIDGLQMQRERANSNQSDNTPDSPPLVNAILSAVNFPSPRATPETPRTPGSVRIMPNSKEHAAENLVLACAAFIRAGTELAANDFMTLTQELLNENGQQIAAVEDWATEELKNHDSEDDFWLTTSLTDSAWQMLQDAGEEDWAMKVEEATKAYDMFDATLQEQASRTEETEGEEMEGVES